MYKITWQNLNLMMLDRTESVEIGDDDWEEMPKEGGIHITDYLKQKHVG